VPVAGGVPQITSKHTDPVEAWWFGWGSITSTTQIANLMLGYTACTTYNHIYHITKNPYPGYINTYVSWTDTGVTLDIDDVLTLTTGGQFIAVNMPTERRKLFAFDSGASGAQITLKNGVIYPEWFGTFGNGASNDKVALENAIICTANSSLTGATLWLDLGGKILYISSAAQASVAGLSYFGIQNGLITGSGLVLASCSNFELRNLNVTSTNYPAVTIASATNIKISDCYFSRGGTFGTALTCSGIGAMRVRNSLFGVTAATGGFPVDMGNSSSDIIFSDCEFSSYSGLLEIYQNSILYDRCTFSFNNDSIFRLGYSVAGITGTNCRVRNCTFIKAYFQIEGMDGMELSGCKFSGITNPSAGITLRPRTTAEPKDFYVANNTFAFTNAATTTFTLVDYSTFYGAYAPATAGALFQTMVVANNILLQNDYNWNEYSGVCDATNTITDDLKKAKTFKTHGNWTLYFDGSNTGTFVSGLFNFCWIGELAHTSMNWESIVPNGGATFTNSVLYPIGGIVVKGMTFGGYGSGNLERYYITGTTRTSARMP
jgi:hypothetical protein